MKNNINWFVIITEKRWGRGLSVTPGSMAGFTYEEAVKSLEDRKSKGWNNGTKLIDYKLMVNDGQWESERLFNVAYRAAKESI